MIEGLRLLPYTADNPSLHCDTCLNGDKEKRLMPTTREVRYRMACGRMPLRPGALPYGVPPGVDFRPECCPGYLTGLPEVQEAVRYRPHWLKGQFPTYLTGDDLTEDFDPAMDAQAVLEGAVTQHQTWQMEESRKGSHG